MKTTPNYVDNSVNIDNSLFDKDLDNVGYEPEIIKGDENAEAAELYGY